MVSDVYVKCGADLAHILGPIVSAGYKTWATTPTLRIRFNAYNRTQPRFANKIRHTHRKAHAIIMPVDDNKASCSAKAPGAASEPEHSQTTVRKASLRRDEKTLGRCALLGRFPMRRFPLFHTASSLTQALVFTQVMPSKKPAVLGKKRPAVSASVAFCGAPLTPVRKGITKCVVDLFRRPRPKPPNPTPTANAPHHRLQRR